MRNEVIERVSHYIRQHHLMEMDKKYLVALSGGADSVCLLLILKQLGYSVEAVHCNFHLRGDEADRDEQFCVSFCEKQQVPLHLVHFVTREYATLHHLSIEMAARELRYHYFASLCRDLQTEGVCVAHHQDDSVETVLLNLIRGTGVHGLTGMAPLSVLESDLKVIRPLLCMSRHEIEQFLQDISQDYVTDSTNLQSDMAVRNKIRMEVIPLLQQINPSVKNSIAETANRMYEVTKVLDDTIGKQLMTVLEEDDHPVSSDRVILSIKRLKALPSSEYALFYILKDYGFNPAQIEQVAQHLDAVPGTEFRSSTHQLLVDRDRLLIEPIQEQPKTMTIPEDGTYVYNEHMKVRVEKMTVADLQTKDHEKSVASILSSLPKNIAVLDAAQIRFPLVIRPVQQGDRFQPFGMKGSKLISDYLTDRKCTLFDKRRQLVVTDADNKILWLVNERPDDCCRVTESTQEVLQVTIS